MKGNSVNHIKVQTNELPPKLTAPTITGTARGIALYYKGGTFMYQNFFTQPLVGRINWLEGLEKTADVHFRSIRFIGTNLFHVRVVGKENQIRKMCEDPRFYELLTGIETTLTDDIWIRNFIEVTGRTDHRDLIVSPEKNRYYMANRVGYRKKDRIIHNIVVVGDRLVGITDKQEVVIGQLTPDVIEKTDTLLEVELMEELNKLGKIELLEPVPNSEELFLAIIGNTVYQFNIYGEMTRFDILEEGVKHIHSIHFNRTKSILATDDGLYEVDVQEMPNMVRTIGLPRKIMNPDLRKDFRVALYVEDPYILGIRPAVGIFSKTSDNEVMFF